tara:strand:- start:637 stop:981 length:345 start_codon:yes stop_codon:yes gene_type:complete
LNDSENAFGSTKFGIVSLEELNTNVDDVELIFESVCVKELGNFVGNKVNFSKGWVLSYQLFERESVFDSKISFDVVDVCVSWITSQESESFILCDSLDVKRKNFVFVISLKLWL